MIQTTITVQHTFGAVTFTGKAESVERSLGNALAQALQYHNIAPTGADGEPIAMYLAQR